MNSFDYGNIPFFDNHSHPLDAHLTHFTPDQLAKVWLHGFTDLPNREMSEDFALHVRNQGCVHTMVFQLSKLLGCEATLEDVVRARNARTANGIDPYASLLYRDAGIFATLVDSELPMGDPQIDLFPGKVIRHIQMDPIFWEVLRADSCYEDMLASYKARITKAIKEDGYVSIKGHVGELFSMDIRYVSPEEAGCAYVAAQQGCKESQRTVYYAIFHQTMLLAHELNIPIHVHTGMTGGYWDGKMDDADPYKMAPFLRNVPHMQETTLVLLHSNYPFMTAAGLMAHVFPNVWVDLAWVLPWVSLAFTQCLEDVLAMAPVSKILLGSGQHNIPEIAWMSSKVARKALEAVMQKLIDQEMLNPTQAFEIAEMVMYKNASRLYGVNAD